MKRCWFSIIIIALLFVPKLVSAAILDPITSIIGSDYGNITLLVTLAITELIPFLPIKGNGIFHIILKFLQPYAQKGLDIFLQSFQKKPLTEEDIALIVNMVKAELNKEKEGKSDEK